MLSKLGRVVYTTVPAERDCSREFQCFLGARTLTGLGPGLPYRRATEMASGCRRVAGGIFFNRYVFCLQKHKFPRNFFVRVITSMASTLQAERSLLAFHVMVGCINNI